MVPDPILLSRYKLTTFLICQRRFQLRYLRQLTWPAPPKTEEEEAILERGELFHQLLQRHFLGLNVETNSIRDDGVRRWWRAFQQQRLQFPDGRFLTELNLTVPIDQHLLHGRFDLLIVGETEGKPFAHVFDWKTGRAHKEAELRQDWQTRLYLAMLADSGAALWPEQKQRPLLPEAIQLTYWYVNHPDESVTIRYNSEWHNQNWAEIRAVVAEIETQMALNEWPLTDDWSRCRVCAYQAYCGRQAAGALVTAVNADEQEPEEQLDLTPQLP